MWYYSWCHNGCMVIDDVYRFSVIFSRDKMVKGASLWLRDEVVAKIRKLLIKSQQRRRHVNGGQLLLSQLIICLWLFRFFSTLCQLHHTDSPSILKQITNRDYEVQVPVAFPSKLIVRDQINWLVLGDSDHLGRVERIPLCYLSDKSWKTLCICIYIIW